MAKIGYYERCHVWENGDFVPKWKLDFEDKCSNFLDHLKYQEEFEFAPYYSTSLNEFINVSYQKNEKKVEPKFDPDKFEMFLLED